jgi:hypothetical protein
MVSSTHSQTKKIEVSIKDDGTDQNESNQKLLSKSINQKKEKPLYFVSSAILNDKTRFRKKDSPENVDNLPIDDKSEKAKSMIVNKSLQEPNNRKLLTFNNYQNKEYKEFFQFKECKKNKYIMNNCFIFRKFRNHRLGKSLHLLMKNKDKFFKTVTQNNLEPGLDLVSHNPKLTTSVEVSTNQYHPL